MRSASALLACSIRAPAWIAWNRMVDSALLRLRILLLQMGISEPLQRSVALLPRRDGLRGTVDHISGGRFRLNCRARPILAPFIRSCRRWWRMANQEPGLVNARRHNKMQFAGRKLTTPWRPSSLPSW
ncbi:hypothetical protein N656DRAFT_222348 [Canariomyces notabilis]|uniref:Uncharacterized protein n=1 Tax=Canariomyces notabilis TaxID=2074819 RepID=A0AAN6YWG2_9PEZI|nr:hypothetical protein N656DRAFT_222348 [Canariomyces arenarius]